MPDLKKYDVNYKRFEIFDSDDEDEGRAEVLEGSKSKDSGTKKRAKNKPSTSKKSSKSLSQFPLCKAAKEGNIESVEKWIKEKPSLLRTRDSEGWAPLHFAAVEGHNKVVEKLCYEGAEVDMFTLAQRSPLMLASVMGHYAVCKTLLSFGANAELKSGDGKVAKDLANLFGYDDVTHLFDTFVLDEVEEEKEEESAVAEDGGESDEGDEVEKEGKGKDVAEPASDKKKEENESDKKDDDRHIHIQRREIRAEIELRQKRKETEKRLADQLEKETRRPSIKHSSFTQEENLDKIKEKYNGQKDPLTDLLPAEYVPGDSEAVEPNKFNGLRLGNYIWGQTASDITIYTLLPPGCGKDSLVVEVVDGKLVVSRKREKDGVETLVEHCSVDFWKPVKSEELMWEIDEPEAFSRAARGARELVVTIPKQMPCWWLRADTHKGPNIDLMKVTYPEFLHEYGKDIQTKAEDFFRRLL